MDTSVMIGSIIGMVAIVILLVAFIADAEV